MDLRVTVFPYQKSNCTFSLTELRQTLLLSCRTVKCRPDRSLVASLPITLVSPGSMYGRAVESARPAPGAPGTSRPHEDDVPVRSVPRAERRHRHRHQHQLRVVVAPAGGDPRAR